MKLQAQPLSAEAFAPFGEIVAQPKDAPIASLAELDYWADVAALPDLGGPLGVGYAALKVCPMVQKSVERHMQTFEVLLPVGGDIVVVVGPADYPSEPGRLPAPESFQAFRVPEGQAVILKAGVWHYAPFAVGGPMSLFVIYKAGTAQNDVTLVGLTPDRVMEVEL